jgi:HK97 family phage major capsid protein
MQRTTMTTSNVANLVESLPRADLYIDSLQPQSAVMAAGATILSGLGKAVSIPKGTGDLTATFVAEGSAISKNNLSVGTLSLSPKRVSSTASFALEALTQSDPSIDNLVRNELTRKIAKAIDDAALEGSGSGANPTGISNTSGINVLTTTGSSTMTRPEALTALAKLEDDNIDSSGSVLIMHPTNYAVIAATAVDSGSGRFVIDNGTILGRRVIQSTLCTAGTVYLGQFRECIVAQFGGVDLVIDTYSEARLAKGLITQHQMVDVGVRHAQAFCKITLTS